MKERLIIAALVMTALGPATGEAQTAVEQADVARAGMPDDVAAAIAAFGHEFDGEIARQTAAIYAPVPRLYAAADIEVVKDLA
jgi:hypothetical protein